MRVLTISDTHGEIAVDEYERLDPQFDACVSLGDVDQETLRHWEARCRAKGVPMYAVVGNHDTWQWLDGFDYLVNVHNRCFTLGNYRCLGFGASYDYEGRSPQEKLTIPVMSDEESLVLESAPPADVLFTHDSAKIGQFVDPALIARVTALIPHAANHPGLLGISNYIARNAPRYAISGHHHMDLQLRYQGTVCIGTYGLNVIDLDTGGVVKLRRGAHPAV